MNLKKLGGLTKKLLVGAGIVALPMLSSCEKKDIEPSPPAPNPTEKELKIDANLEGKHSAAYKVTMQDISEAGLNVSKNGEKLEDKYRKVTPQNNSGVYNNLHKGNYELKATSGNLSSSANVTIPNYEPTLNSEGLETNVKYGDSISWNLEDRINDDNVEDTVRVQEVKSLDGNFDVVVNGYNVTLKPNQNVSGPSDLEITVGSPNGGSLKKTISIDMEELKNRNYSGTLEDNITNTGVKGKINVYGISGDKVVNYLDVISQENFLGQIKSSIDGKFGFEVSSKYNQIVIEATQDGNQDQIFTRVVDLDNVDSEEDAEGNKTGIKARIHKLSDGLYNNGEVTKEKFRKHIEEANTTFSKFNLDGFKGIEILYDNPFGKGTFTTEEQNVREENFREAVPCFTDGKLKSNELYVQKDDANTPNSEKHYELVDGKKIAAKDGWIIVAKDTTLYNTGEASIGTNSGTILLRGLTKAIDTHELGHILLRSGHTSGEVPSIMDANVSYNDSITDADCEKGSVFQEETYPYETTPYWRNYDKILKLSFEDFQTDSPKVVDNN